MATVAKLLSNKESFQCVFVNTSQNMKMLYRILDLLRILPGYDLDKNQDYDKSVTNSMVKKPLTYISNRTAACMNRMKPLL